MSGSFELHRQGPAGGPARRGLIDADAALAGVAHDLRDGLSLVRAAAEHALATPHGVRTWREEVLRIEAQAVRLGQAVDDLLAGGRPAPAEALGVAPSVYRAGERERDLVLVVDDDEAICDLAVRALDDRYDVAVTGTAADALRLADELRPALVVAESVLPDTRGEVLLERVHEQDGLADVPFVLIPAAGSATERDRVRRRGANAVLCKPFGAVELRAQVDAVLDGRPAPPPVHEPVVDQVIGERALETVLQDRLWRAARDRQAIAVICARVAPAAAGDPLDAPDAVRADETLDRLRGRLRAGTLPQDLRARLDGRQLVVLCQRPELAQARRAVADTVPALLEELEDVQAGGVALRPTELGAREALARARASFRP